MLKNELNGNNENTNPETNMGTENSNNPANEKSIIDEHLSNGKKILKFIKEDIGFKSPAKVFFALIFIVFCFLGWEYKVWGKLPFFNSKDARLQHFIDISPSVKSEVQAAQDSVVKKEEQKSVEVARFNALEKALLEEMSKSMF